MTETKPSASPIAGFTLLGACFFWAASFIATKTALANVPPLTVVMLRMVVSSLCYLLWLTITRRKLPFHGYRWLGKLFLCSLFGAGLHYSVQTIGIQYTTASNSSIYVATGPITITIIAAIFLGERITWKKALGIFCALIGVFTVMGFETILAFSLKGRLLGDLLVFSSIFMWGIFTVMSKGMTRTLDPLDMTAIVTFLGTSYMIPLGWWEMKQKSFSLTSIPADAWASIAFLGIFCSFMAVLLYIYSLSKMESQKVAVYLYTIPPMTYIFATLILKESITVGLIQGTLIVMGGVYITQRG